MILLLGDYAGHVIGGRSLSPEEVTDALKPLGAPLGVFAVFGNHDWRNDPAPEPGTRFRRSGTGPSTRRDSRAQQ
jgi:predicted MPP superfamily phosphohydrolase